MGLFNKKTEDSIAAYLKERIKFLEEQWKAERERNDRLTEAICMKSGIDLVLPITPRPAEPAPEPIVPAAKVDAWWKANVAGHTISTPVREETVSAPKS